MNHETQGKVVKGNKLKQKDSQTINDFRYLSSYHQQQIKQNSRDTVLYTPVYVASGFYLLFTDENK